MGKHYLHELTSRAVRSTGGSKANNLRFLLRQHFPVPSGWVVSWEALSDYLQQGEAVIGILRQELSRSIQPDLSYAVRSSASVEDSSQCSCAGLFRSFLQVKGVAAILNSIQAVWLSLESAEFQAYSEKTLEKSVPLRMAVIIQEMVPAEFSGIIFSKNPLTGLTETIVEVGRGNGDDQAAARQDPERWVSKWGNWLQKPERGLISDALACEIVRQTQAVVKRYGQPVDLEWASVGNKLYFLQVRPITRLDIPIFSNKIAREMLPGIIKPLVWSVNTRLINQTWVDILTRLTGDRSFCPDELTGHYYYRAYFNMAVFGRVFERLGMPYEALELLFGLELDGPDKPHMRPGAGILVRLPRLLGFACSFLWIEWSFKRLLKGKKEQYEKLIQQMKPDLSAAAWLEMANRVFSVTQPVARFNILIPMLAMMYHRLLTGLLKKHGYDTRLLELSGVKAAAEQFSPHIRLEELHRQYYGRQDTLTPEAKNRLNRDLEQFLEQFGHFSDSGNDCSSIPWRETPRLIREMIARPIPEKTASVKTMTIQDLKLPWTSRAFIKFVYRRTSRFAVHREAISSLYTYGYGQFRKCFIGLGSQLANAGVLEHREDIFYLYWRELIDLVGNPDKQSQVDLVRQRRQAIEQFRDITLPDMIFGQEQPPVPEESPNKLKGIPTSLGTYTGPARVLRGLTDYARLVSGDVLIIPFSDVGWTPLFARAGAVVAESGGILSHSSIVAREYRIPAVVSVSGACRIADGTIVTVNGYTGDVILSVS